MSQLVSTNAASIGGGSFQAIYPGTSSTRSVTSSSAQTAAVGAATTIVRVICTVDCFLVFGSNPTANTSSSLFLPAGTAEYFGITPGYKIAAIRSTADGTLYITEGA
jgi:hypothetical protein